MAVRVVQPFSEEEGTWINREQVLQKNDENSFDGTCEERRLFKKNDSKKGSYT